MADAYASGFDSIAWTMRQAFAVSSPKSHAVITGIVDEGPQLNLSRLWSRRSPGVQELIRDHLKHGHGVLIV